MKQIDLLEQILKHGKHEAKLKVTNTFIIIEYEKKDVTIYFNRDGSCSHALVPVWMS